MLLSVVQWDGGPSGTGTDWNVPANWSGDVLPGAADDVVINAPGGATITHASGDVSIRSLTSQNAVSFSGGSLTLGTAVSTLDQTLSINGASLTLNGSTLAGAGSLSIAASNTVTAGSASLQLPVVNQGTMTWLHGNNSIQGPFTNSAGATLRVLGQWYDAAALTIAGGLTNQGTMELTSSSYASAEANLAVTGGTLTNAGGGVIRVLAGAGAGRSVSLSNGATLLNQAGATLQVNEVNTPLTMDATSIFTNEGTVDVGADRTLSLSGGGKLRSSTGQVNGQGTLSLDTIVLESGTVSGTGTVVARKTTVPAGTTLVNTGLLVVVGTEGQIQEGPLGSELEQ